MEAQQATACNNNSIQEHVAGYDSIMACVGKRAYAAAAMAGGQSSMQWPVMSCTATSWSPLDLVLLHSFKICRPDASHAGNRQQLLASSMRLISTRACSVSEVWHHQVASSRVEAATQVALAFVWPVRTPDADATGHAAGHVHMCLVPCPLDRMSIKASTRIA